jgi:ABC-type polar amino acid transport system ATPase subunit
LPQDKIVVTHDVRFAEALAKRAVFFEKGTVAGEGAVPDVVHRFGWSAPPAARP